MSKTQLTSEGHQQLLVEYKDLQLKADQLVAKIEDVAQPDESGEDSLATQLKAELEVINSKIASIEDVLDNFEIVTNHKSHSIIDIGSQVKIKIANKIEKIFHIVGDFEANPSQNKISIQSPLGQALVGKKVHDEFEVDAPAGKLLYKIVAIA